jgi:hypothetical protein
MQLESLQWAAGLGWSAPFPSQLDGDRTLVLAFGDPELTAMAELVRELRAAFPRARVMGCSTAGQILGETLSDETLVVSVTRFERTAVAATVACLGGSTDSFEAGREVATTLNRPDLRAILVLSDGLLVNGSELVRGIGSVVTPDVIVTGGLAGDGERFVRTWVVAGDEILSGAVTAVGLSGDDVVIGVGSFGGWDPFGPERLVTRSKGNVLYELDGQPALGLYKEYLGERASGLPATALLFPLAVRAGRDTTERTVRTVLAVEEHEQSMTFAGDVAEGSLAQLMHASKDRLVDGATRAAAMCRSEDATGPQLAVAISCVGRRLVLGERTEDEIEATLDALGAAAGSQLVGFYSYGEIAPHGTGSRDLHNQTMTITTIAER